jgi:hypothetical protein
VKKFFPHAYLLAIIFLLVVFFISQKNLKIITPGVKWNTTNLMGTYTFDYPDGWHVVSLFPSSYKGSDGDWILINPEPISTAPRGGPAAAIELIDYSGLESPELFLEELIEEHKNIVEEVVSEEEITTSFGKIKYLKGKINVYGKILDHEIYYFMVPSLRVRNDANKHVIEARAASNEYYDILRKMVLSFKQVN